MTDQESLETSNQKEDPQNYYKLGMLCLQAPLHVLDVEKAYSYIKKAADGKDRLAQYMMGRLLYDGTFFAQDYAQALKYFEMSAWQNYGPAYNYVGRMNEAGLTVGATPSRTHQMYSKARLFLRADSRAGDPEAFSQLGLAFIEQLDCDRDYEKAREYFEQGVKLNDPRSCLELGLLYQNGLGVEADRNKAFELFMEALKPGYMQAHVLSLVKNNDLLAAALGTTYVLQGNDSNGYDMLFQTEMADIPLVSFALGFCLYNRNAIDPKSPKDNAQHYFNYAIEHGIGSAASHLGDIYELIADYPKCIQSYKKACELNDDLGLYTMGLAYYMGLFVVPDRAKGIELLERAAEMKFAPALNSLGLIALYDEENPDYVKARKLFEQTAKYFTQSSQNLYRQREIANLINLYTLPVFIKFCDMNIEYAKHPDKLEEDENHLFLLKLSEQFAIEGFDDTTRNININNFDPEKLSQLSDFEHQLAGKALASLLLGKFYINIGEKREQGYQFIRNVATNKLSSRTKDEFRDVIANAWYLLSQVASDKTPAELAQEADAANVEPNAESQGSTQQGAKIQASELTLIDSFEDKKHQANARAFALTDPRSEKEICLAKATIHTCDGIFNARSIKRYDYGKAYFNLLESHGRTKEALSLLSNAVDAHYVEAAIVGSQRLMEQGSTEYDRLIHYLNAVAEGGILKAHLDLANIYLTAPKHTNITAAIEHYKIALDSGLLEAAIPLAELYEKGRGCPIDLEKAFEIYMNAAVKGNADAQFRSAECYYYGRGVKQDIGSALNLYGKAATQEQPDALFILGKLYEQGKEVRRNVDKAIEFYQRSANAGHAEAAQEVNRLKFASSSLDETSNMLDQLLESPDSDINMLFNFYQNKLIYNLGQQALGKEIEAAKFNLLLSCLDKIAQKGHQDAQLFLLGVYQNQVDTLQNANTEQASTQTEDNTPDGEQSTFKLNITTDLSEAQQKLKEYQLLTAQQNYAPTLILYANECFAKQDYESAYQMYQKLLDLCNKGLTVPQGYMSQEAERKAAKRERKQQQKTAQDLKNAANNAKAQQLQIEQNIASQLNCKPLSFAQWQNDLSNALFNLGQCLEQGLGCAQQLTTALEWYNKATELGSQDARFKAAMIYLNGVQGISADPRKAVNMLSKLTKRKHPQALFEMAKLYQSGSKGVSLDPKEAFNAMKSAAELGHVEAMALVSKMYEQGQGTQASPKLASQWLEKAKNLGWQG